MGTTKISLKKDNNIVLKEGKLSVWSWDESSRDYLLSDDVTDSYKLVECLEPVESIKGKITGTAKIHEYYRQALKKGLKVNPCEIDDSCSIFVTMEKKDDLYMGVLIKPGNYQFHNGVVKAITDENNADTLFATLASVSFDNIVDNGTMVNGKLRNIALLDSMIIINERFPLVDLVSVGKKIIKDYFTRLPDTLGANFTTDQIKEIIQASDKELQDYATASATAIEDILSESGVAESIHSIISGLGSADAAIEKYLSRNVEFQEYCCEVVRNKGRLQPAECPQPGRRYPIHRAR